MFQVFLIAVRLERLVNASWCLDLFAPSVEGFAQSRLVAGAESVIWMHVRLIQRLNRK